MINQHFYLTGDKMQNNCGYGCCMHCQYLLDDNNKYTEDILNFYLNINKIIEEFILFYYFLIILF